LSNLIFKRNNSGSSFVAVFYAATNAVVTASNRLSFYFSSTAVRVRLLIKAR